MTTPLLTLGDWIDVAPWKGRGLLLMFIPDDEYSMDMSYAISVTEKREVVGKSDMGTIVAVWPGQWSTSARVVAKSEVESLRARLS